MMRIDSHLHLWVNDPEKYPWQPIGGYIPEKDAPLAKYLDAMAVYGIDGAVFVQPTPYGWDNKYLLDCKKTDPEKFKAVVLVDPLSDSAAENMKALAEEGADGLRVNLQLQPVERWQSPAFTSLIKTCNELGLPVCFQTTPEYFDLINELAVDFQIPFVIDHLGRPEPGSRIDDPDFIRLLNLSDHPNIFIKLSGLNYYSQNAAPFKDTWAMLKDVKDQFGAEHCMWGSDFPFIEENWSFGEMFDVFDNFMGFTETELEWILGKTAQSLWWRA